MDPQPNNNLESLVRSCTQGDTEAYRELYDQLHKPLFGFIITRTNSREDAKDILQDVFVDLWRALARFSYRSEKQFYSFVYTIAKRKLARYYDSHTTTVELTEKHIGQMYSEVNDDVAFLLQLIKRLKPKYREVLELRYCSDLLFADIALLLNTKETTVKVRHHRALKQLHELLREYGE